MSDARSNGARERILAERAQALAAPLHAEEPVETIGVLLVRVGKERYAIELAHVRAIERAGEPTPVPGVSEFWAGLANVHGALYAILDLGRYLGIESAPGVDEAMLVLVSGGGIAVGLQVDEVSDVTRLRGDEIEPSPSKGHGRRVVQGVTRDLVALLDVEELLADPALVVDDEAA